MASIPLGINFAHEVMLIRPMWFSFDPKQDDKELEEVENEVREKLERVKNMHSGTIPFGTEEAEELEATAAALEQRAPFAPIPSSGLIASLTQLAPTPPLPEQNEPIVGAANENDEDDGDVGSLFSDESFLEAELVSFPPEVLANVSSDSDDGDEEFMAELDALDAEYSANEDNDN